MKKRDTRFPWGKARGLCYLLSGFLFSCSACGGPSLTGGTQQEAPPAASMGTVAVGANHSCAIENGEMWCWGEGRYGQLGESENQVQPRPIRVEGLPEVTGVDAARNYSCALGADGSVWCWGEHAWHTEAADESQWAVTQIPGVENAQKVSVGYHHACALLTDHGVQCWGDNRVGQLGRGDRDATLRAMRLRSNLRFVDIAAGAHGTCASTEAEEWMCWGRRPDEHGLMEVERWGSDSARPVEVEALRGAELVDLGRSRACAASGRTLRCSGSESWELEGTIVGLQVTGDAYGENFTACARTPDGTYCVGDNGSGQLGLGDVGELRIPTELSGLSGIRDFAVGPHHGCGRRRGGDLECWGSNVEGQRGIGQISEIDVSPTRLRFDGGQVPSRVTCLGTDAQVGRLERTEDGLNACFYHLPTRLRSWDSEDRTLCWDIHTESGEAVHRARATSASEPPFVEPVPEARVSGPGEVTVCLTPGDCRALRVPNASRLLSWRAEEAEAPRLSVAVTGEGNAVSFLSANRRQAFDVEEVGPVSETHFVTYSLQTGRRLSQVALPVEMPTDDYTYSSLRAVGPSVEVYYEGLRRGVELRDPLTGAMLKELGVPIGRWQVSARVWVYGWSGGDVRWIDVLTGDVLASLPGQVRTPRPSPVNLPNVGVLDLSGDQLAVVWPGVVQVVSKTTAEVQSTIPVPFCLPE